MNRIHFNADNRFVYGPYTKFPYPNDVYYPTYTYNFAKGVEPNSLKSAVAANSAMAPMPQPYVFRHYLPPTYVEMYDYLSDDLQEAKYNEYLRRRIESGADL